MRLETYLLSITNFKLRGILTKFRMSSHNLEIERGRYTKPAVPAKDRLCKVCNLGVIEDEEHVLMKCEGYENLRAEYFNLLLTNTPNVALDFIEIMGSKDQNVIFYTAKLLEKIFSMRNKILNCF